MLVFPPVRTLIGLAYSNVTPTLIAGASYEPVNYPLAKLFDNAGRSVWRAAEGTIALRLDLGAPTAVSFLGLVNHNVDRGRLVTVYASGSAPTLDLPPYAPDDEYTNDWAAAQLLARAFSSRQPCCWVDTRDALGAPTTARYWQVHVSGNSRPLTIGELVIGHAAEYTGVISSLPFDEQVTSPQVRHELEYGARAIAGSGALLRQMDLTLTLSATEVSTLQTLDTLARANFPAAARVVVIPDSRINDLWHVDWETLREYTYPLSDRMVETRLQLVEEAFGVV